MNVGKHRPRGFAGVDLHFQNGLFERFLYLYDLEQIAFDLLDGQEGGKPADRHNQRQHPETEPKKTPHRQRAGCSVSVKRHLVGVVDRVVAFDHFARPAILVGDNGLRLQSTFCSLSAP